MHFLFIYYTEDRNICDKNPNSISFSLTLLCVREFVFVCVCMYTYISHVSNGKNVHGNTEIWLPVGSSCKYNFSNSGKNVCLVKMTFTMAPVKYILEFMLTTWLIRNHFRRKMILIVDKQIVFLLILFTIWYILRIIMDVCMFLTNEGLFVLSKYYGIHSLHCVKTD